MKPRPAKVNTGVAESHFNPCHGGSALGSHAMLPWRTATPFGMPVVPDVYMTSARSVSSMDTWMAAASSLFTSSRSANRPRPDGPTVATTANDGRDADNGATASSNAPLQTTAVTSACSRMDRISGGDSRLFMGTDTAPILWTAL